MTTDPTPLQERIARALYENAEYYGPEPTQPPWDSRDDEERREWMEIAAAVLPIIAAEVRAASERAWGEGVAMAAHHGDFDGSRTRWLSSINPYSITEKENA